MNIREQSWRSSTVPSRVETVLRSTRMVQQESGQQKILKILKTQALLSAKMETSSVGNGADTRDEAPEVPAKAVTAEPESRETSHRR